MDTSLFLSPSECGALVGCSPSNLLWSAQFGTRSIHGKIYLFPSNSFHFNEAAGNRAVSAGKGGNCSAGPLGARKDGIFPLWLREVSIVEDSMLRKKSFDFDE